MKKLAVFGLLALAGCVDITQYISFNDKGQTVSSVQISFSSAMLEIGRDAEELKSKFSALTNSPFSVKTEDTNIMGTNFMVSNSVIYGIQFRLTAPKHYFASAAKGPVSFPVKESYGFSLPMRDAFKNSEDLKEFQGDSSPEMDGLVAIMFKHRILLSKADLPRPLIKAALSSSQGAEVELPVTEYGAMYVIDVPFNLMGESQKIEFHFAPK